MADQTPLDSIIQQNDNPVVLPRVNIDQPVPVGHDMVVNHVDGTQELAPGHVAVAVHAQEAATGEVVSLDSVTSDASDENPRSKDPEVNQPDASQEAAPADTADQESEAGKAPAQK